MNNLLRIISANLVVAILLIACFHPLAEARSSAAVRAFKRAAPCPETGVTRGSCHGWQVDHIVPLCAGGADTPSNMQWLAVEDHKAKTRKDVRSCRLKKKVG
ncbi:HNH endonuclease signature motif containing protein [Azonexus sp.]|jgi:5-methylcytosine-specific restriction endonuclease McrA|uniref:HNH endonuclease signature motif containing protein n=1 Tax=Azonexus sp. TaxID=1872668 RepID=UPI002825D67C|nr:HNH endonuclease signature motif containing protein [Azonexus sp.]MDR1995139.1 HNH endonuclease [Azonexus sp.]